MFRHLFKKKNGLNLKVYSSLISRATPKKSPKLPNKQGDSNVNSFLSNCGLTVNRHIAERTNGRQVKLSAVSEDLLPIKMKFKTSFAIGKQKNV